MDHLNQSNVLPFAQTLYDKGSREDIVRFLQWNDPNGVYTDEVCREEGYDIMSYDEALIELEGVIETLETAALVEALV